MEKQSVRRSAISALMLVIGIPAANASDLPLNFQPAIPAQRSNALDVYCIPGSTSTYRADTCVRGNPNDNPRIDPDKTPFLLERMSAWGAGFYHVLIGDPESDFSQEYYIFFSGTEAQQWPNGFRLTTSDGTYNGGPDARPDAHLIPFIRPLDDNDKLTGNASGYPARVIFKQTLKGVGFDQEITKGSFLKKPLIIQNVSDNEMVSNFRLDMTALGYGDVGTAAERAAALNTPGVMTNTMKITDAKTGAVYTDFDINTTSQKSFITGGKYTYRLGTGEGGSMGTYTYASGTYDIHKTNWKAYLDKNDPTNFDYANTIPNY